MIVSLVLCAFFVAVCDSSLFRIKPNDGTLVQNEVELNDFINEIRTKRSSSSLIGKLLKTTTAVFKSELQTVYKKSGGYGQAVDDFKALKPKNTGKTGDLRWGTVGKHRVSVQNEFGKPVMILYKRGVNKDGTTYFKVNKIEYF